MTDQVLVAQATAWLQAWQAQTHSIAQARPLLAVELAGMIDHTLLKAEATPAQIDQLCQEARDHHFASVCVNSAYAAQCAARLAGSGVPVCSVVGFPLGAMATVAKAYEARVAIEEGASEIDMVIHVGALVGGDTTRVQADIAAVVEICHSRGAICKVIIEAALLSDLQKVLACRLLVAAGADFAKTSTGFGPGGATAADVALLRAVVGPKLGVKAAGGIRTYETAAQMVASGATRLGASAGIQIVAGAAG